MVIQILMSLPIANIVIDFIIIAQKAYNYNEKFFFSYYHYYCRCMS